MSKQVKGNEKLAKESASNNTTQTEQEINSPADEITEGDNTKPENQKAQNTADYPPGVTQEPQHPEHMDLKFFKGDPGRISQYLKVSDDQGEFIEDIDFENQVKNWTSNLFTTNGTLRKDSEIIRKIGESEELLPIIEGIAEIYGTKVSYFEGISQGTIAKYRIRQGMLLLLLKIIVKKLKSQRWEVYITDKFGAKSLRSIQDYTSLAKVPNIIRYSILGLNRLLEIKRVFDEGWINTEDPVGEFLETNDIAFDFESDDALEKLKLEVDAAIVIKKIEKICEEKRLQVNLDSSLMRDALSVSDKGKADKIIDYLVKIIESNGDPNIHLTRHFINGGAEERHITDTRKLESFQKLVVTIKTTVAYLIDHNLISENIEGKITELEEMVSGLRSHFPTQSTNTN